MKRLRKIALLFTAIIFLMVGGAAAFLFAIQRDADPRVTADIDAHFAALASPPIDQPPDGNDGSFVTANGKHPPEVQGEGKQRIGEIRQTRNRTGNPQKQPKKQQRKQNRKKSPPAPESDIRKIAPGTWLISRKMYTHARGNMLKYVGKARAELVEVENEPVGFRLKNIKKNSALHRIGLRNNDVLIAINGFPLNSVENVTAAIASFQKANQFRLDILRKESRRSFYYKITNESRGD